MRIEDILNQDKSEIDELQMYFGEDYKVNDYITIHQPTIQEIVEFGESATYSSIAPFTGNPTSYRLQLWDVGIDWNKISDFDLFTMLVQGMSKETTSLIFGDFDFSVLKPYAYTDAEGNQQTILADSPINPQYIIDESLYLHIREYIREMFDQHPKVEKAKGRMTKEMIIDEERMKLEMEKRKKKDGVNRSFLLPLISAMVNHPGFKYKKNELKEIQIVEFMDSVKRLQVYESTRALMSGMYSGMLDTSKMNLNKELNWLRDLHE